MRFAYDGRVRLWLAQDAVLLRLADERVSREFTEQELRSYADLIPAGTHPGR